MKCYNNDQTLVFNLTAITEVIQKQESSILLIFYQNMTVQCPIQICHFLQLPNRRWISAWIAPWSAAFMCRTRLIFYVIAVFSLDIVTVLRKISNHWISYEHWDLCTVYPYHALFLLFAEIIFRNIFLIECLKVHFPE